MRVSFVHFSHSHDNPAQPPAQPLVCMFGALDKLQVQFLQVPLFYFLIRKVLRCFMSSYDNIRFSLDLWTLLDCLNLNANPVFGSAFTCMTLARNVTIIMHNIAWAMFS